jgi:hypothetical protein
MADYRQPKKLSTVNAQAVVPWEDLGIDEQSSF